MLRIIQPYRASNKLLFGDEAINLLEEVTEGRNLDEASLFFSARDEAINIYASLIRIFFDIEDEDFKTLPSKYFKGYSQNGLHREPPLRILPFRD